MRRPLCQGAQSGFRAPGDLTGGIDLVRRDGGARLAIKLCFRDKRDLVAVQEDSERSVNGKPAEAAAPEQRDRVIPLRKSDLIDGLLAEGRLDQAEQATLRQLARMLGAIFHYQYLEELDRLRDIYFQFDPEIDPKTCGPLERVAIKADCTRNDGCSFRILQG
jgi:hypothetical protein